MTKLNAFHAYDYYNTTGAQRDLTPIEKTFYSFCCENHEEICSEDTPEDILKQAGKLYSDIMEE